MAEVKHMDIKEFQEVGYLQEVNRLMLHPLGLALEVAIEDCHHPGVAAGSFPADRCDQCDEDGKIYRLSGIWDCRDDPEGIVFAEGNEAEMEKAERVAAELDKHIPAREGLLGDGRFVQGIK